MSATILRAGFLTTVQDLGRPGHRASGVSVGGALDPHALKIANLLVGNEAAAAGLEVNLSRFSLRCADQRLIAWCGGAFRVQVDGATLPPGRPALIRDGEVLSFVAADQGARAWIAISGGVDVPAALGSRSTDLRSGFGGFDGRALRDGDVLEFGQQTGQTARIAKKLQASRVASWMAPNEWTSPATAHGIFRIVRGADWPRFEKAALARFLGEVYTVSADSDRMGIRLEGPVLRHSQPSDLLSAAVAPGTIQVPPKGQPILLLGDCQTIGGYPKLAHVITVDLPAAAQLRPRDPVRFAEVELAEAQRWLIEREQEVARFRIGLQLQTV